MSGVLPIASQKATPKNSDAPNGRTSDQLERWSIFRFALNKYSYFERQDDKSLIRTTPYLRTIAHYSFHHQKRHWRYSMWKAILVGTTALTLIGGSLAYAQDATSGRSGNVTAEHHPRTAEERAAFIDARISELKADLHLTSVQEKNWATFETTLRDTAKARAARFEQFHENVGQQTSRADLRAAEDAEQRKLAAALDPLYKGLDAGQQQVFAAKFDVNGEGRHFWFKRQRDS
jgi:hypothetical protein